MKYTNTLKLPPRFKPPREVVRSNYVLEVLAPQHNDMDYEAWTSSIDELQGIFGPTNDWPTKEYTKEQNLEDLERHLREFEQSVAYAYTILNVERTSCIGCLYIRPTSATNYDARVDFWFRNSSKNIESHFYEELKSWLGKEWRFQNIAFPGRNLSWDEYNKLVEKESW
ncbi:MAG: hypothetical protein A3I05_06180 [Deltaproteobacteria bacterium RIFCSPLOWO2_02_FULL_44_10]|nr:MAG: hypothetical protein A3C46_09570 [Deltaproteobacteria bacterium RIFCSPHIGHO2_02_FULL_44_16]OGQ45136.1 MAG: hypothetical protein A3I05_06180 [Deltaproteobacteria bacterium RIFCSPLOWO2_02_FULL_44_10]